MGRDEPGRHPRRLRRRHRLPRRARRRGWARPSSATSFVLGPGGKGSNQAVAAARLGAEVTFITRLGADAFGEMALAHLGGGGRRAGGDARPGRAIPARPTSSSRRRPATTRSSSAPGAAATIAPADIDAQAGLIAERRGLRHPARAAAGGGGAGAGDRPRQRGDHDPEPGAGAGSCRDEVLALCDYLTPNETEAEALTGLPVGDPRRRRGRRRSGCCERGVGDGGDHARRQGALLHGHGRSALVPAVHGRAGGGDDRRRRRLQRRLRDRAGPRHGPDRGGALRLRRRRDLGDPARDGAVDADARRGRGAAGAGLKEAAWNGAGWGPAGRRSRRSASGRCPSPGSTGRRPRRRRMRCSRRRSTSASTISTPPTSTAWGCPSG